VDTRRLRLLLELSRLGSMRAVADELYLTTSTVSQQLAVLAREVGTPLLEPAGRRVRLTPAGRRLADHAVTILAAVEAARLDLDPGAEPAGVLRVAGFASAVRRSFMPIAVELAANHPKVRLLIHEHETAEAYALLAADEVDLALTYDYDLAPAGPLDPGVQVTPLWTAAWYLGVPVREAGPRGSALAVFDRFRAHSWIVNSRNTADEQVIRTVASMAGFEPTVAHRADSLELVEDLIVAGLGVGLLPASWRPRDGVALLPLTDPGVMLRSYAALRRGRATWPPLALVLDMLIAQQQAPGLSSSADGP
jgi:DNA-binding transcriptional LysR family regulator